ncbi:MAG: DNA polymerase IV [Ilumatobacteraceae bacterium]
MPRSILHVDMDAFFVSVELLRRPELRGQPVVVGGTGERGVVAAASYEARRYGIHSAMPSVVAQRRCPHAVFLPGDHARYSQVSAEVFSVFHEVTPLVEGLSLDEAFLDVSGALRRLGPAAEIGRRIRATVLERTGLCCSVGVAPNKFLAKLASESAKPRIVGGRIRPGSEVLEVRPGEELAFLRPLPVRAMWGVGPATFAKLQRLGVETIADLADLDESTLVASLGASAGRHLHRLSGGHDERPVEPERAVKSISHEVTFPADVFERDELRAEVVRQADAVAARLRANGHPARTITLKVRFAGFDTITRARTPGTELRSGPAVAAVALELLEAVDLDRGVRLIGVAASGFEPHEVPVEQLSLDSMFDQPVAAGSAGRPTDDAWDEASSAIDAVRARFGAGAIGPTSSLVAGRLSVTRKGQQQWGPDAAHPDGDPPRAAPDLRRAATSRPRRTRSLQDGSDHGPAL